MQQGKYSLKNEIPRWRPSSGVPRGCVPRIRLWPLRRDYHSGVLIGAGGRRRSDWSARVLANDVSTRIDRQPAHEERSIARVQAQVAATDIYYPNKCFSYCYYNTYLQLISFIHYNPPPIFPFAHAIFIRRRLTMRRRSGSRTREKYTLPRRSLDFQSFWYQKTIPINILTELFDPLVRGSTCFKEGIIEGGELKHYFYLYLIIKYSTGDMKLRMKFWT